jgi:hypothetical protein
MNKQTDISKAQASASLAEIKATNEKCKRLYRAPIWVNVVLASLASALMFGECVRHINNIWYDIQLYVFAALVVVGLLHYLYLKKQGISLRVFSASLVSKMYFFGTLALIFFIKSIGQFYIDAGYTFTPYVVALVTFAWFFYVTYKYPSYDLVEMDD